MGLLFGGDGGFLMSLDLTARETEPAKEPMVVFTAFLCTVDSDSVVEMRAEVRHFG